MFGFSNLEHPPSRPTLGVEKPALSVVEWDLFNSMYRFLDSASSARNDDVEIFFTQIRGEPNYL